MACHKAAWPAHKSDCKYAAALAALAAASEAAAAAAEAALGADAPGDVYRRSAMAMEAAGRRSAAQSLAALPAPSGAAVLCVRMRGVSHAEQVLIDRSDPIFERGELSPVMARCGVPLALVRSREGLQRQPRAAELDNQAATFFMIPPVESNAFAPAAWQWNVGEVTLVRRDRRHLSLPHFYHLWDFFATMLTSDADRLACYSPRGFRAWSLARVDDSEGAAAAAAAEASKALHGTW